MRTATGSRSQDIVEVVSPIEHLAISRLCHETCSPNEQEARQYIQLEGVGDVEIDLY